MLVIDKVLFRCSVQSYASIVSGASHWFGVLENTETTVVWETIPVDTKQQAFLDLLTLISLRITLGDIDVDKSVIFFGSKAALYSI